MTVADPAAESPAQSAPSPPTPEECPHPAPVLGVMAHEFSPYRDARGPEGKRRTTMFYGPVVGGLPIEAWHCEVCGLLRLTYFDGRKEERRLFPGAQPGLIATPMADVVAPQARLGHQLVVSGVTLPAELAPRLIPEPAPIQLPTIDLPDLGWSGWITTLLVAATCVELVILMIGAVAGYTTYSWVGGVAAATAITFGLAVLTPVSFAAVAHFLPPQGPSAADLHRGRPVMDGVTYTIVTVLVTLCIALGLGGILAIYDWRTPGAELPLFWVGGALAAIALLAGIGGFAGRRIGNRP